MKQLVYEDGKPTDLDVAISDNHFRSAVKGADENTSASPSGFGYVVWKTCGLSPIASKVHSIMMSLPFQHGFSPSRWRQCLEVMLDKVLNDHDDTDTDIWREVTDSEELVALLLERNADHM